MYLLSPLPNAKILVAIFAAARCLHQQRMAVKEIDIIKFLSAALLLKDYEILQIKIRAGVYGENF